MKIIHTIRFISVALIILGLLCFAPALYYRYKLAHANAMPTVPVVAVTQQAEAPNLITGHPVNLSIPSTKINVGIIDGQYNQKTKQWTLTNNKAQFATITSTPNNIGGNTYIYGHYRPEVFAYLHIIKPGAEAYVKTDNGYIFTYRFREVHTVDPTDSSIFAYQGAPILTLQTCSGAWFQNRQQYTFDFIKYEKQTYSHPETK